MYTCNSCNNRRGCGLFSGGYQPFWIVVVIAIVVIWIHCGCGFGGSTYGCDSCAEPACGNGCGNGCGCNSCC